MDTCDHGSGSNIRPGGEEHALDLRRFSQSTQCKILGHSSFLTTRTEFWFTDKLCTNPGKLKAFGNRMIVR